MGFQRRDLDCDWLCPSDTVVASREWVFWAILSMNGRDRTRPLVILFGLITQNFSPFTLISFTCPSVADAGGPPLPRWVAEFSKVLYRIDKNSVLAYFYSFFITILFEMIVLEILDLEVIIC